MSKNNFRPQQFKAFVANSVAVAVWAFTEFLGWTGGLLVAYSLVSWITKEPWPVVERYALFFSSLFTLLGTALTAASVYFHSPVLRAPWQHSKYLFSPVVICACIVAIVFLLRDGNISQVAIGGFAMVAIAGGLKRLLPYPKENIHVGYDFSHH